MVHAIHPTATAHTNSAPQTTDTVRRTHLLAITVLTSVALLAVLPLELSIPLCVCILFVPLLGDCPQDQHQVVRVYTPPVISEVPMPRRYYQVHRPPPIVPMPPPRNAARATVPSPFSQGARAGVGVRAPSTFRRTPMPQTFSVSGQGSQARPSAPPAPHNPARAPVGRR